MAYDNNPYEAMEDNTELSAPHLGQTLEETLETAKFFTFRGCEGKGEYSVPKIYINAVLNWAGSCTDPFDVDSYKKPEAMFEALDLIFKVLQPLQNNSLSQTIIELEKET